MNKLSKKQIERIEQILFCSKVAMETAEKIRTKKTMITNFFNDVIKVVVKEVGEQPKVKFINNNLISLRKVVGGFLEIVPVLFSANRLYMVCNDTAKLDFLPFNFYEPLRADTILGNVFFTACDYEGNFIDLSNEQIKAIKSYLNTQTLWQ